MKEPLTEIFAACLVAWQAEYGRHNLPWQNTRDAYRIWLSEIMLQQTQVATVIPYYTRFLERFPNVETLAVATQDEVMALWAGLGYYSRARNLHKCAQSVMDRHGGVFPESVEMLIRLPGIGRSTASAIAVFAYDAQAAILDGNVKRVLARVFGIEGFPGTPKVERKMWALAESLLPAADLAAYTQGMMDLGATLCSRVNPRCEACPFDTYCFAHATGREHALPTPKPRKLQSERFVDVLVLCADTSVLFERRPDSGIWGGLWSFPELTALNDYEPKDDAVLRASLTASAERFGKVLYMMPLAPLWHIFTHFKLFLRPWLVVMKEVAVLSDGFRHFMWLSENAIDTVGLPSPIRQIIDTLYVNKRHAVLDVARGRLTP
ncbi:A/G-specific adenine glycosylase [Candidatus Pandoraea novymonadis]|uniref:Adenine DNA glycosylase n=1 Tax=Candidatus Pandoraea novymonadis TaxID=1808959 RepID=A0ABX5FFF6_9BURK|nr:A/G-specific adenine glycosylase [Candidatus Pandoraea novymonadis]PSB91772.1 Adenine DNA glycosylase [Candidatus Pandoraea novymonadis]